MTGQTLRDLLPAGSARNKIEFLADELQYGLELLGQLEKAQITNYVKNPAFLDSASNKAQQTNFTGPYVPGSLLGSPHQNTGTFADGWHFEQDGNRLDPNIESSFSAHRNLDFPLFFTGVPFKASDIWVSVKNCKGTVYQGLNLPRKETYYKARCFFAAEPGMTVTLGFRYVDSSSVGAIRSETSLVTSEERYEAPPSTSYNVVVMESQALKLSRARNDPEMVCLEVQSPSGEMAHLMLLGMQVIEVDKDGQPVENGIISMDSDGYGHLRFHDSIEFACSETSVTGNEFTFKAENPGLSLYCPHGVHQHVTCANLSFWGGVNALSGGSYSSGQLDDGITITGINGDALTIELSQVNADLVRNCGGMYVYLRYNQTPMTRGIYA
ncbi:hypothetical protein [Photobacterium atrarenae]|uniref:Uncharacterized protein n=1 Tax=Photobacterium atrarenae TaxID=865757 RepID=A0ABY5GE80_9GAMM|nr:hypothetical protein [Photobacterium atrarenae]UTV27497.1 hypothetical protein NNL38_14470 [Photobacterium atrarenae]